MTVRGGCAAAVQGPEVETRPSPSRSGGGPRGWPRYGWAVPESPGRAGSAATLTLWSSAPAGSFTAAEVLRRT